MHGQKSPALAGGILNNPNSASANVTDLVPGVYHFELEITDDKGGKGKDTMEITVNSDNSSTTNTTNPTTNLVPVADAGQDTTVVAPVEFVTLNGRGADKDGSITSYSWNQISGPSSSTILSDKNATTSVGNLTEGTYTFELTVTDNNGAEGRDTVNVTVALGRYAPLRAKLVRIYPNPVHDIATLEINTGRPNTNVGIVITDLSGRTVYTEKFVSTLNKATEKINMSSLIKGIYLVTVYFDGTKAQTIRVIRL